MSRKTLIKFCIAAAILGVLLVSRHTHAERHNRHTFVTIGHGRSISLKGTTRSSLILTRRRAPMVRG